MERLTPKVDVEHAAQALSMALMQKTTPGETSAFLRLHRILGEAYPLLFKTAYVQVVEEYGLLLHISGCQSGQSLLFTGHLDVAPVCPETREDWEFPPFAGTRSDGCVWGRGALDMKGHLICLMEAAESLLATGWRPEGDIWFALSCNAETRGSCAQQMFRILKAQGVHPAFILDEGSGVIDGQLGIEVPMALIGIGEKGHANFTLSCKTEGGRGSYPPRRTALSRVIRCAKALDRQRLGRFRLSPAVRQMLLAVAPHLKQPWRFAAAHPRLCSPLTNRLLSRSDVTRALTHTTLAVTMAQGSSAPNTLPRRASVTFNCRIAPGETAEKVKKRLENALRDPQVTLTMAAPADPSGLSPCQGPAWDALVTAISIWFPQALAVPYLMPGAGGARRYEGLSDAVYRFSPFRLREDEQAGIHSVNERISLDNLETGIQFFQQMLQA